MLKSVRYGGFPVCELRVVWLQPLAAPTTIVACGPRRISAAMSTMYETDMLEPLAIGSWILKADVSDDSSTRKTNGMSGVKVAAGRRSAKFIHPRAITERMYQRP